MVYENTEIKQAIEIYKKKWLSVSLTTNKPVINKYLEVLQSSNNTLTAKNVTANYLDKLVSESRNTKEYLAIFNSKYLVVRPGNTRLQETDIYFRNRLLSQDLLPVNAAINYILDNNKTSYEKRVKAIDNIYKTNETAMNYQITGEEMTTKEKVYKFLGIVAAETYNITKTIGKSIKTAGKTAGFLVDNLPLILIAGVALWFFKGNRQ